MADLIATIKIADGYEIKQITESTKAQMQYLKQENQNLRRKNKEEEDKNKENIYRIVTEYEETIQELKKELEDRRRKENLLLTVIEHYQKITSSKTLTYNKLLEEYNRSMTKHKKGVIE